MQESNQSRMESVKECHIQLHSSPNMLPYQVVDDGQGLKSPTTNLVDDLLPECKSVGDRRSQPCSPIGAAEENFGQGSCYAVSPTTKFGLIIPNIPQ